MKSRLWSFMRRPSSDDSSASNRSPGRTPPTPTSSSSSPHAVLRKHPHPRSIRKSSSQPYLPDPVADPDAEQPPTPARSIAASIASTRHVPPDLTLQHPTPPPAPPLSERPASLLFQRSTSSYRPALLRASSRSSYPGRPVSPLAPTPFEEPSGADDDQPVAAAEIAQSDASQAMPRRKVWVSRPAASATLVQVMSDDLVDDVRDMILRKYANSLGRSFDAPDVTIRIKPRDKAPSGGPERTLGPDELMCSVLDAYFPGGQAITEALLIDVPKPRTPKPSPRPVFPHQHHLHFLSDQRPTEDQDTGYFPPMPAADAAQAPAVPSPSERRIGNRPQMRRQQTSSPVSHAGSAGTHTGAHRGPRQSTRNQSGGHTPNPSVPTPPANETPTTTLVAPTVSSPKASSPLLPPSARPKRTRRTLANGTDRLSQPPPPLNLGRLDGALIGDAVPPINVLIVEDNIVNLKLLEVFLKRLKVRWASAMNGRDAVNKWREGGFHLVLMDIQLPIMSGLEATTEIRRLERINGIGVFARSEGEERAPSPMKNGAPGDAKDAQGDDKLTGNFKSPVIIVALTASSLQSDRREALAAGCNDFLTKPVNFPWFERKILEWGCMQALIDFDGWRQWKALSNEIGGTEKAAPKKPKKDKKPLSPEEEAAKQAKKAALLAKMGAA